MWQVKYGKLRDDWMVILELLRQHKERMALLAAKKTRKASFHFDKHVTFLFKFL